MTDGPDYVNVRRAYPTCRAWPTIASTGSARPTTTCPLARPKTPWRAARTGRHAERPQQPVARGRTGPRRQDRHDHRGRRQPALVGRGQRQRLHRRLGQDARREAIAGEACGSGSRSILRHRQKSLASAAPDRPPRNTNSTSASAPSSTRPCPARPTWFPRSLSNATGAPNAVLKASNRVMTVSD